MEYSVGGVYDGKVTGITKFGAFVNIGEGKSGLVHISEIANTFVREVREHLTEGQEVKVKIIGIDESGRINLSIKKALAPAAADNTPREYASRDNARRFAPREQSGRTNPPQEYVSSSAKSASDSFEDKLKSFMQDSNSRMADLKHQGERKGGSGRPRRRG